MPEPLRVYHNARPKWGWSWGSRLGRRQQSAPPTERSADGAVDSPAERLASGAIRRWNGSPTSSGLTIKPRAALDWEIASGAIDSPAERFASGAFRLWKGSPASSDQTVTSSAALDWEIASGALRQRSAPPIEQSIPQRSDSPGGRFASGAVHNKTERCARLGNRQQSAPPTERSADEAFGSPAERFATGMVR